MQMKNVIVVRGGGDIATGTIHRLHNAGYSVLVLETAHPSAIRREVSFSEAVYDGEKMVERVTCRRAESLSAAKKIIKAGDVALMVDENGSILNESFHPHILIDAILAKKNIGTDFSMADFIVGIGPGFCGGRDVHCVIETMRGHNLGRLIYEGRAMRDTGVPGAIAGVSVERVIHAPAAGRIENERTISSVVKKDEIIAEIFAEDGTMTEVRANITGILRGIIRNGYKVTEGLKIADVDPRSEEQENCFTISDKSRCISGSVLEAVLAWERKMR